MKYCKPLLCALLCFSLCLSVCSANVNAAEAEIADYYVYVSASSNTSNGVLASATISMTDGEANMVRASENITLGAESTAYATMYLGASGGEYLFRADSAVNVVIEDIYCRFAFVSDVATYYIEPTVQVAIEYIDGTIDYDVTERISFTTDDDAYSNVTIDFVPTDAVSKIHITYIADLGENFSASSAVLYGQAGKLYITCGEYEADKHFVLTAQQQSEEAGLLEGLLAKMQGVWDSIMELPSKIGDALAVFFEPLIEKVQGLWDSIKELPNKIWERAQEGLLSLVIPSEEYMVAYGDKWEMFLADRLGAVWQVVDVTFGAWEDIDTADAKNTIEMPTVTIPLPDDNTFSFGGYSVQIVPTGFEGLADTVKVITGILCTFAFINGLRKRYDEVMGVEK